MHIRPAAKADLEALLRIYEGARQFMAQSGNPGQWGKRYPSRETVEADIAAERCYVCEEEGRLYAAFVLVPGEDPTYRVIDGSWSSERPYGVIHRIAAAPGSHGILDKALGFAFSQIGYIRIDTHRKNIVMDRALTERGFRRCGIITIADGTERVAYDKEAL